MALTQLSFAVGSKFGPRSARWIVSVSKDGEVFVTAAAWRKDWKVTLHKSGRWHLKFLRGSAASGPPAVKTHQNEVPAGKAPVGVWIRIPDSCLRPASYPERTSEPNHWLERPAYNGVVDIAIAKWDWRTTTEEWPGQSAGTRLWQVFAIDDYLSIGIILQSFSESHPISVDANQHVEKAKAGKKPIVLDSPERRGFLFGKTTNGGILIMEFAID